MKWAAALRRHGSPGNHQSSDSRAMITGQEALPSALLSVTPLSLIQDVSPTHPQRAVASNVSSLPDAAVSARDSSALPHLWPATGSSQAVPLGRPSDLSLKVLLLASMVAGLLLAVYLIREERIQATSLPGAVSDIAPGIHYLLSIEAGLAAPLAVAIGPSGDVYVTDSDNGTVRRFGPDGMPIGTFGQKAQEEVQPGDLSYPVGLALDQDGRLYVSDVVSGRISLFDGDGRFLEYFAEQEGSDSPVGKPGALFLHRDLLYVSDLAQHKVLALRKDGTLAQSYGLGKGSDPGQLSYPGSIWVDDMGAVYVADANNGRVQVFAREGALRRTFGQGALDLPRGIAAADGGWLYVSTALSHGVQVFSSDGKYLFSFGAPGSGPNELGFPNGIAIANNRLYVADRANNRVQVFSLPPSQ